MINQFRAVMYDFDHHHHHHHHHTKGLDDYIQTWRKVQRHCCSLSVSWTLLPAWWCAGSVTQRKAVSDEICLQLAPTYRPLGRNRQRNNGREPDFGVKDEGASMKAEKGRRREVCVNPFTVPACKISGLKSAHIHACKQYIWWSCNNSTFSTVHFDNKKKNLSRAPFKFGTVIFHFSSDRAESLAVKGLKK